jgi:MarR family transcriptional regulator, organic hydroperoxide resistance regulator
MKRPVMMLDDQVCFALYHASNLMTRAYRPHLRRMGLTYPQYLVMLVLWETSEQTVTGLGSRLSLTTATLTPMLKRLEAAGMVTRRRSAQDGREVRVRLAPKGRALYPKAQAMLQAMICSIGMDPGAAENLRRRLHSLIGRLAESEEFMESAPPRRRAA